MISPAASAPMPPRPRGDSVDPTISKFYGDVSEIDAASTHLLFFALELNRIDDDILTRAMQAPELAHLPSLDRGPAQEKPYQLDDKLEQLFLEKAQDRLLRLEQAVRPDISGLRFKVGPRSSRSSRHSISWLTATAPSARAAAEALAKTFKANERPFR